MRSVRHLRIFLTVCIVLASAVSAVHAQDVAGKFTFAVFGDNRPARSNRMQSETFKRLLKDIDSQHPSFIVNTGDCIFGSGNNVRFRQQYKDYTDTVASLTSAKVYLALGNHEVGENQAHEDFFAKELGGLYYSFDFGGSHFIVLDTEIVGQAGRIAGDQLAWLKADLDKSQRAHHRFIFMHRPMYPVDGHIGSSMDQYPLDRDSLHRLFIRERVAAVYSGHENLYNKQVKSGIQYIITGGGGASVYPSRDADGDFFHYLAVTVNGDSVSTRVVKLQRAENPVMRRRSCLDVFRRKS